MDSHNRDDQSAAEQESQRLIAEQAAEIARLRRELDVSVSAQELQDGLRLAALAGTIAAPVTHTRLLEMIVETAADVINAHAASLFLIDVDAHELVFEVALGEKAEEVKKFRVPMGHGIAGLVAATGQPMAVADTASDSRDATDIAEAIGYHPKNILCVPLFFKDDVIGVLELLDKEGGETFSATDMETLGLFANQAAVAIEQSRLSQGLGALLVNALNSISGDSFELRQALQARSEAFVTLIENDPAHHQALELAKLVQEISQQGAHEALACRTILDGFAEYLRTRPQTTSEITGLWP